MKLTNDFIKVLSKLRDNAENGETTVDNALSEIESVKKSYVNIAERKKTTAFDNVIAEYDANMAKIKKLANYAKTIIYLLSEGPGSDGWNLACSVIDAQISEEDD